MAISFSSSSCFFRLLLLCVFSFPSILLVLQYTTTIHTIPCRTESCSTYFALLSIFLLAILPGLRSSGENDLILKLSYPLKRDFLVIGHMCFPSILSSSNLSNARVLPRSTCCFQPGPVDNPFFYGGIPSSKTLRYKCIVTLL